MIYFGLCSVGKHGNLMIEYLKLIYFLSSRCEEQRRARIVIVKKKGSYSYLLGVGFVFYILYYPCLFLVFQHVYRSVLLLLIFTMSQNALSYYC